MPLRSRVPLSRIGTAAALLLVASAAVAAPTPRATPSTAPCLGYDGFVSPASYTIGSQVGRVAAGYLNPDAEADIVVIGPGNAVSVLVGAFSGFAAPVAYSTGQYPADLAIADLNNDGAPDVVTADFGTTAVSVLFGAGDGTLAAAMSLSTGSIPTCVALGDVNADGTPDIIAGLLGNNGVAVLLGTGNGAFAPAVTIPAGSSASHIALGEVNGDGRRDLAVADQSANSIVVLLGVSGPGIFGAPSSLPVGSEPTDVVLADISQDGLDDVIAASSLVGYVTVNRSLGGGAFAPSTYSVIGPYCGTIAVGDLDFDGVPDLVAEDGDRVEVLTARGDGTFGARANSYAAGPTVHGIAIARFGGGDMFPDIVVGNGTAGTVSVLAARGAFGANYLAGAHGTLSGVTEQTITAGESGTPVTAIADAGYRFAYWSDWVPDNPLTDIGVDACFTVTAVFDSVVSAPNCRVASSVYSFSSQLPALGPASAVLGPPDVYPVYARSTHAWSPATPQAPEFLDLRFDDPAPINYVNIYETWAPGSVQSISVLNPFTSQFEVVWSGTAAPAALAARMFTVGFTETAYPVSEISIEFASQLVPDWNSIDAVAIGKCDMIGQSQWATAVTAFSSQYSAVAGAWSAQSAVGPPDVYPRYGDFGAAWASSTPDFQREYLELTYATPQEINVVNVVETLAPGALDLVAVKNPSTGLFETVWTGNPVIEPPVARVRSAAFPTTRFPVSEVRVEFDSPFVPGWNEIDAVGIGQCGCTPTATAVERPEHAATAMLDAPRPGVFREAVEIAYTLAVAGPVTLEVYNVRGRRVARLVAEPQGAGAHRVRWQGRDDSGRAVGAGIYVVRLAAGGVRTQRTVARIK